MQMNEQVLIALEVLRHFTENDFERRCIDVLEKDLTDPPKVEQIDDNHQKFNDVVYTKIQSGHYNHTDGIHVAVYRYYNGEIPKTYEVHHKDENPANNDISNLRLLSRNEHAKIHHGGFVFHNNLKTKKFICQNCGKEYEALDCGRNKFCSNQCCDAYYYLHKIKKQICPVCGKEFEVHTYQKRTYCSNKCSGIAKRGVRRVAVRKSKTHKMLSVNCVICGKTFITRDRKNRTAKTCSRSCAAKFQHQRT